jgi:outer membrane lipoprotein-sorting protein
MKRRRLSPPPPLVLVAALAICAAAATTAPPASAPAAGSGDTSEAATLLRDAIDYWRGSSSFSVIEMTVHRPQWERTSVMRSWTRGSKDALVRFVEPAKDAGSATLKVGDDMWIFTPRVNRVIKLPFSMMAQSWMGSDFSYNDLAKSDQIVTQYDSRVVDSSQQDGHTVYRIEAIPKADAPVIWGKQEVRVRDDSLLLEETFFDQDGRAVKRMSAEEIGPLGGKLFVTRYRMEKLDETDHWTEIVYRQARFGDDLPDALFTQSNLRNPRSHWEDAP